MKHIFSIAAELEQQNIGFALVTIISALGSTPRSKAHMIVTEDDTCHGTIGGGLAERFVIEECKRRLITEESGIVSYRLDHDASKTSIDMLCGGDLELYIEIFARTTTLILIGGGHVNLEIAHLAHAAGLSIIVVETRQEFADSDRFPMAKQIYCAESLRTSLERLDIDEKCAILIATHDHDKLPLELLIEKDYGYLGMLGSRKKVAFLKEQLGSQGIDGLALKKLHAPAGLDIGAETPKQIALSIVSEIMLEMNGTSGIPLSKRANNMILVRGAGDIATGTIIRLVRSGFRVMALETARPTVIRRTISFAQAVYDGSFCVEGITAKSTDSYAHAKTLMDQGIVPVMVDPQGDAIAHMRPNVLIDAILAKKNLGTKIDMAPIVIGLGPGFTAKADVDAVIETNRGHDLGRVILEGKPAEDTGIPGVIAGVSGDRVLRSPTEGEFTTNHDIGDMVTKGDTVACVGDQEIPATITGVIRGLLVSGMQVTRGFKIGDIDPRGDAEYCHRVSDKARAVAGGVLEAVLALDQGRHRD